MAENNPSSRSNATSLEDMGAFWDTHDFTEHDPGEPDVTVTFRRTIAIEAQLWEAIAQEAHQRGVTIETLINLWLQQKLGDHPPKRAA
jgi:hypothetical protein